MRYQRGFSAIFIILLLLVLVALVSFALYINKTPQPAPLKDSVPLTKDNFEKYYNPFGDHWDLKKALSDKSIPVMLTPACVRYGPKISEASHKEIEFLKKSNAPVAFEECSILSNHPVTGSASAQLMNEYIKDISTKLKEKDINYLSYIDPIKISYEQVGSAELVNVVNNTAIPKEEFKEAFLYDESGEIYRIGGSLALNPSSTVYRNHFIPKIIEYADQNNLNGVFVDFGVSTSVLDDYVARGAPVIDFTKIQNGEELKAKWNAEYANLFKELKQEWGEEKQVFVNMNSHDLEFIKSVLPYIDGLMLEDPLGRVSDDFKNERLAPLKNVLDIASDYNKYVLFATNTNANCPPFSASDLEPGVTQANWCYHNSLKDQGQKEREYAEYYLAVFLSVMRPKNILTYYTPTPGSPQFHSSAFYHIWDINIGSPVSDMTEIANNVFTRSFENGEVIFNSSDQPFKVGHISRELVDVKGVKYENNYVIPAHSGRILMTAEVFEDWNSDSL